MPRPRIPKFIASIKKPKQKHVRKVRFTLFSGNIFDMRINKFATIKSIIIEIDETLKKLVDSILFHHYYLIYNNEKIDIDIEISKYYCISQCITIIILQSYSINEYPYSYVNTRQIVEFYNIPLHNVSISTGENNIRFMIVPTSEKWIYGCRCEDKKSCSHKELHKFVLNIQPIDPYRFSDNYNRSGIGPICCNIWECSLSQLCEDCFDGLMDVIYRFYVNMRYPRRVDGYKLDKRIDVVYNQASEIFFERFKDLITYYVSYYTDMDNTILFF